MTPVEQAQTIEKKDQPKTAENKLTENLTGPDKNKVVDKATPTVDAKLEALKKQEAQEKIVEGLTIPPTFKEFQTLIDNEMYKYKNAPYQYLTTPNNFLSQLSLFAKNNGYPEFSPDDTKNVKQRTDGTFDYSKNFTLAAITSKPTVFNAMKAIKTEQAKVMLKTDKTLSGITDASGKEVVNLSTYTLGDAKAITQLGNDAQDKLQYNTTINLANSQNIPLSILGSTESFATFIKDTLDPNNKERKNETKKQQLIQLISIMNGFGYGLSTKTDNASLEESSYKLQSLRISNFQNIVSYTGVSGEVFNKILKPRLEKKYPGAIISGPKMGTEGPVTVGHNIKTMVDTIRGVRADTYTTTINAVSNVAGANTLPLNKMDMIDKGAIVTMDALTKLAANTDNNRIQFPEGSLADTVPSSLNITNIGSYNNAILSRIQQISPKIDLQYTPSAPQTLDKAAGEKFIKEIPAGALVNGTLYNISQIRNNKQEITGYSITTLVPGPDMKNQLIAAKRPVVPAPAGYIYEPAYDQSKVFPELGRKIRRPE